MTRRFMEIRLTYTANEYVQYADNMEWHELLHARGTHRSPSSRQRQCEIQATRRMMIILKIIERALHPM